MPPRNAPAAKAEGGDLVEARVLSDCSLGNWGDVITVERSVAESSPFLDSHPDAVAYAKAQKTSE